MVVLKAWVALVIWNGVALLKVDQASQVVLYIRMREVKMVSVPTANPTYSLDVEVLYDIQWRLSREFPTMSLLNSGRTLPERSEAPYWSVLGLVRRSNTP